MDQSFYRRSGIISGPILKGKLKMDGYLLGFAFLGLFLIPAYFYRKNSRISKKFSKLSEDKLKGILDDDFDIDKYSFNFTSGNLSKIREQKLKELKI